MRATTVSRCRTQYPYVENISDYGLRWRTYAETSKNEDTWWSVLWHLRCRIRYSPESTQGAVAQTAHSTYRNSNDDLYVRYLYWDDSAWNWNCNWLVSSFNSYNPAVVLATLLISPSSRGSFVL